VSEVRIAVVGVGPRGLSVLERVISHTRGGAAAELLLIEPGELGVGIHCPEQPDYLLLNTIASQLTIFSDPQMTPGAPVTTGPSLFEWCRRRDAAVRFDEYLPRARLGEYLRWSAAALLRRAPANLAVRHLRVRAIDIRPDGAGAVVTLSDGARHHVDLAIVTTGHGVASPPPAGRRDAARITDPYPLPQQVEAVAPEATVALIGTGLTAMDVIAALTVGRGGRFSGGDYISSGQEPRIILANRTGWLPCARPATTAERRAAPARFFTPAGVERLRHRTRDGRLDFRRDVEPLVVREALWRLRPAAPAQVEAVLRILRPVPETLPSFGDYQRRLVALAVADLREAKLGLGRSPVKESLEVLRDHRESLRVALDDPGLTDESYRFFTAEYVPVINRAVIGPQKERIGELLALMAAGIVQPGPGPAPELVGRSSGWELRSTALERPHRMSVDVAISAHLPWPADPACDPVASSLRSWVKPGPEGALGLDRDGFAVSACGAGRAPVAVFGPPAEGASYYNHYVPSPGVWSRALTDLDRVLAPVLNSGGGGQRAAVADRTAKGRARPDRRRRPDRRVFNGRPGDGGAHV
jgi:hypothetical protein